MVEHSFGLLSRDAGKPCQKIVYTRPLFQILEEGFDRNAGIAEYPCPADSARYALHAWAR